MKTEKRKYKCEGCGGIMEEKCECGKPANGKYYYPYLGGFWKHQCVKCSVCFQAYIPYNKPSSRPKNWRLIKDVRFS